MIAGYGVYCGKYVIDVQFLSVGVWYRMWFNYCCAYWLEFCLMCVLIGVCSAHCSVC